MAPRQRHAVWLLGLCQCVLWGVLYYGFSVLLVPIAADSHVPRTTLAAAFSSGLAAMALLAPTVGRWLDAGHFAWVGRAGCALAILGLLTLGHAHGVVGFFAGWSAIGAAMAMLLYESAFALVTKTVPANDRLRALAAVTVFGGLASTLFLPILSWLIERQGWRETTLWCAGAVLAIGISFEVQVLRILRPLDSTAPATSAARSSDRRWPPYLRSVAAVFASGTLAGMGLTTLLVPLLVERGMSLTAAAFVLGTLGLSQLPGRVWLLRRGANEATRSGLHLLPLILQATGLLLVILVSSPLAVAASVMVFGLGAGLQTLARPWLVQSMYGAEAAGRWNGEVARLQGIARAAGPALAAAGASLMGSAVTLALLAALLVAAMPLARRLAVRPGPQVVRP